MATIQIETTVTITADRSARDVLGPPFDQRHISWSNARGVISGSDAQAAHEALDRATHLVEMFDQLGRADADPLERSEITVALDSWLRGHRGDLAESPADEIRFLRGIAAGDEPHGWGSRAQPGGRHDA
jgi:hypothetical protein